jgi:hypothetical protein
MSVWFWLLFHDASTGSAVTAPWWQHGGGLAA